MCQLLIPYALKRMKIWYNVDTQGCVSDRLGRKENNKNMMLYKNLGGNSGIRAYLTGTDRIDVQFDSGKIYRYSYRSAGRDKVEQMKKLAVQGQGLNSYITKNVRKDYETVMDRFDE